MDPAESKPEIDNATITWADWLREYGCANLMGLQAGSEHPFDQVVWSPGKPDQQASWKLYTELRTRITTQPLAYRAGDEEAALDSVYRLFEISRTVIKENPGCTHFATVTSHVLNGRVRPFTAKWHQAKIDGRLSSADIRFSFRRELLDLQFWLRLFTHLLGLLAGDPPAIAESETKPTEPPPNAKSRLLCDLPFGIITGAFGTGATPDEVATCEAEEIAKRRTLYSLPNAETTSDAVGLSISGGGIRSATFAMGILQELARKGILHQVDYLSTVSGGGYLGSFISSFLNDPDGNVTLKPISGALPFGQDKDLESQGVRQLRNHSKYLSEGGFKTLVTIVGLVLYGLLVSATLVAPFLLSAALVSRLCFGEFFREPVVYPGLSWATVVCIAALAVGVLVLPCVQRFGTREAKRYWGDVCVAAALLSIFMLAAQALPYLFWATVGSSGPLPVLMWIAVAPLFLGVLGLWLGMSSRAGQIILGLFAVVGPLITLGAFLCLLKIFIADPSPPSIGTLVALTVVTGLYATFILDINQASPHPFYRNRLARTFLVRNRNGGVAIQSIDPQMLSTMNESSKAPYHLINCALNIPSCKDPNLRGRNTDFFLFSKHYCGSPLAGFHPTKSWETMDPHLDLGTAVAISGAAAAPHMGTLTSSRYTFLLAMLNVRLGYWLRRPREGWHRVSWKTSPSSGLVLLFPGAFRLDVGEDPISQLVRWRPYRKPWHL